MGQYHMTVNLDKREFVSPPKLASGLKLWEQLANEIGPGKALIVLLAHPEQRGGGDLDVTENWHGPERKDMTKVGEMPEEYPAIAARTIGRWRGDRIAIIGDYAENGDLPNRKDTDPNESAIYGLCWDSSDGDAPEGAFKDVSDDVAAVIAHELCGAFVGNGWKHFYREDQEVKKWKPDSAGRETIPGKIEEITATTIKVKFEGEKAKTYKLDADIPYMF